MVVHISPNPDGDSESFDEQSALEELFGPVIFKYTLEDAVRNGMIRPTGMVGGKIPVYFTSNLLAQGYEDPDRQRQLVVQGVRRLALPDPEDTDYMKLRVLKKDEVWVVFNADGMTYMLPEDY